MWGVTLDYFEKWSGDAPRCLPDIQAERSFRDAKNVLLRVCLAIALMSLAGCAERSQSSPPGSADASQSWLVAAWYPEKMYLVHPDGSDYHALDLDVPGEPLAPSWSPDGKSMVFVVRSDTDPGSIWTSAPDGANAHQLLDGKDGCPLGAFWPVWSPDGSRLAIICYRRSGNDGPDVSAVSLFDPADGSLTELAKVTYPTTIDNPPSWSPDGSQLVFELLRWDSSDTQVEAQYVATVPVAGGRVHRLTDEAMFAAHPDWSPDGSTIVVNTYDTGNIHGITEPSNLYTIRPDGSGQRQLTTASVDGTMRLGQPFWSPDGTRIWVSIAEDWEKDSQGQFMNTLGWVDPLTGELHRIGSEGKRWREQPTG